MTEDEAATELLRRQALAETEEFLAGLKAHREEHAGRDERPSVALEPRPVRRAPERREMSPPIPDKVQLVKHDAAGRAVALVTFEGQMSVSRAASWESYVEGTVANAQAATRSAITKQISDALANFAATLGGEISKDLKAERERAAGLLAEESARMAGLIERQAAQIEQMARRLEQLEARAAPPPRLVAGESDAAD